MAPDSSPQRNSDKEGLVSKGALLQFEVASTEATEHVLSMCRRGLDEIGYPVPPITAVLPLRKATVGTHGSVPSRIIVVVTRRQGRKWMRFFGD